MSRLAVIIVLATSLIPHSEALGQERECEFSATNFNVTEVRPGEKMSEWSGSVLFQCSDGTVLRSDHAIRYDWLNEMQFNGNVTYRDSTRTLTANYVRQAGLQNEVYADGGVVITDHATGAVIRGTAMQVWGESELRTESLMIVRGRPTAVFEQARGTAGPGPEAPEERGGAAQPSAVHIVADSMQVVGNDLFRALGRVELSTEEGQGRANAADYYMDEDRFRLRGNAEFHDRGYTTLGDTLHFWMESGQPVAFAAHPNASLSGDEMLISGDSIHGDLTEGRPREVRVVGNAHLTAETARMEAWRLTIEFEGEELSVLRAIGPSLAEPGVAADSNGGGAAPVDSSDADSFAGLARIHTADHFMAADSIEVIAPGGELQEIWATGNAYAEQLPTSPESTTSDSAAIAIADPAGSSPEELADGDGAAGGDDVADADDVDTTTAPARLALPDILSRDWLRGDTVIAYFGVDSVAADTAREALEAPADEGPGSDSRVLQKLVASGAGGALASAVYRMANRAAGAAAEPTIHYVRSSRIELLLQGGAIATADFGNPVYGRSYQPIAPVVLEAPPEDGNEAEPGPAASDDSATAAAPDAASPSPDPLDETPNPQ